MSDAGRNSAASSAVADLSGRQVGDLRLLRRLGRGAMAEVYLAEQLRLKRRVAVKILKPALAEDHTYLKRFEREAQAAASLVHANIVQIHEVGHAEGLHYIVQEYVPGLNLRQWISRYGPADLGRAVSIMRQTAAALAKATDAGVVHRDIKPENIMLTPEGEVKVADFGLARVAGDTQATELTQVGMTMGTPLYMSPEQVEGKPLDGRSDLYSFGVTCYQMFTGNPPFVADTALGVAVQHLKREPAALESLRPISPGAVPHRSQDAHQGPGGPLAVGPRVAPRSSPRAAGILRRRRRGIRRLAVLGRPAGRPAAGGQPAIGPRHAHRRGRDIAAAAEVAVGAGPGGDVSRRRRFGVADNTAGAAAGRLADRLHPGAPPGQRPAQYDCASQIGTEEAWRSVLEYFPEKESVVRRAKQQLARIYYFRDKDYDRATAIFDELAASTDADKEYRAWGLAGKVGVLTLEGKYKESAEVLDELWPLRGELRDKQMQELLRFAVKEINSHLGCTRPAAVRPLAANRIPRHAVRGNCRRCRRKSLAV